MAARAASTLFVVESATKANKIRGFLGPDVDVQASYGHLRQLPRVPSAVQPALQFSMAWEIVAGKQEVLAKLEQAAQGATTLILGTDPDREGEGISWHLLQILMVCPKPLIACCEPLSPMQPVSPIMVQERGAVTKKTHVKRVTFTTVTQEAVMAALASPRALDQGLVDAYLSRAAMDFLLGFTISPLLWQKLPSVLSAGRVQSPALRLICEREDARDAFTVEEYFSLAVQLVPPSPGPPVRTFVGTSVHCCAVVATQKIALGFTQQCVCRSMPNLSPSMAASHRAALDTPRRRPQL